MHRFVPVLVALSALLAGLALVGTSAPAATAGYRDAPSATCNCVKNPTLACCEIIGHPYVGGANASR